MTEERPPVVIYWWSKKLLIRGMPTNLLCYILKRAHNTGSFLRGWIVAGNTHAGLIAVARELLSRKDVYTGYATHIAKRLLSPPCACGKAGLYIVNQTTYCSDCKPRAEGRRRESMRINEGEREASGRKREAGLKRADVLRRYRTTSKQKA